MTNGARQRINPRAAPWRPSAPWSTPIHHTGSAPLAMLRSEDRSYVGNPTDSIPDSPTPKRLDQGRFWLAGSGLIQASVAGEDR